MRLDAAVGISIVCVSACFGQSASTAALPNYKPETQVSGVIRMYGADLNGLVLLWENGFARLQPRVSFTNKFPGSDAAISGLDTGDYDLAPNGREATLIEYLSFSEAMGSDPFEIKVATGAYDIPGRTWAPVVFVSKDNPLTRLTMKQLDGIFGEQRSGGYQGYVWEPADGRTEKENIRTWGQLGLGGEWADKPIQTYGYAPTGMSWFFQAQVLHGNDKWNPNYREYVESGTKMVDSKTAPLLGSHEMLRDLAADKYGIGWSGIGQAKGIEGLKAIALARNDNGPYVMPSYASVADRSYPLTRSIFIYMKHAPGSQMDPKLHEFLDFILSRQGQALVEQQHMYIPLTKAVITEERSHLNQ